MRRRFSIFILFLLALFLGCAQRAEATSDFQSGSGTINDPYHIATCQQLQNINLHDSYLSAHFILTPGDVSTSTIDCSGIANFTSLGDPDNGFSFNGRLNGNHKVIENLTINHPLQNEVGLFIEMVDATVRDLTFSNASTTGSQSVGTLAGSISNSAVVGVAVVNSQIGGYTNNIGGLGGTGYGDYFYADSIDASSTVRGFNLVSYGATIGGIIGQGSFTNIVKTSSAARIQGREQIGGLAGYQDESSHVIDSIFTGQATSTENTIGGLIG